jgi:hypothetical protein
MKQARHLRAVVARMPLSGRDVCPDPGCLWGGVGGQAAGVRTAASALTAARTLQRRGYV